MNKVVVILVVAVVVVENFIDLVDRSDVTPPFIKEKQNVVANTINFEIASMVRIFKKPISANKVSIFAVHIENFAGNFQVVKNINEISVGDKLTNVDAINEHSIVQIVIEDVYVTVCLVHVDTNYFG